MPRRKRDIPKAIQEMVTAEDLALLRESLEHFDGSYRELMDHLKSLGAEKAVYWLVNGSIKSRMRKGRGDVNLGDHEEMWVWGDGYQCTQNRMDNLEDPVQDAWDGFTDAMKINGWESWE